MSNNVNQANFIIKWKSPTAPAEAPYYPLCPAHGARGPDSFSRSEPVHSSDKEARPLLDCPFSLHVGLSRHVSGTLVIPIFTGQDSQVHDAMQAVIFCLGLQDSRQCQFNALLGSLHAMAVSRGNIKISRCAVPGL